jgi:hypothetical protein
MKQRMGYVLVLALTTGAFAVSACGDDSSSGADDDGGSAGESGSSAGSKTGGSTSGGSAPKAGANSGGKSGSGSAGTSPEGGTGGATGGAADGGAGGVSDGGAGGSSAGAAGSDAGAGGAGGAGEPPIVYACGSDTNYKKLCSAKVAAACPEPTDCADCVAQVSDDYDGSLTGCASCDALMDKYYQCGVDAFDSGNTAAGMQCVPDLGADFSDECSAFFFEYFDCGSYLEDHTCPATWPQ